MRQYGLYKGAVIPLLTHKKQTLNPSRLHECVNVVKVLDEGRAFIDWNEDLWIQVDDFGDYADYQCADEDSLATGPAN